MAESECEMRKLRYRIRRQGMLELDAWLSRLEPALENAKLDLCSALVRLLECEPPELLAMMRGDRPVPEPLRPWLQSPGPDAGEIAVNSFTK